jgi:hypothetical protein
VELDYGHVINIEAADAFNQVIRRHVGDATVISR